MPNQSNPAPTTTDAALPLTICSKCRQSFATPSLWLEHAKQCNPIRYRQVAMQINHLPDYYSAPALPEEVLHVYDAG